LIIPLTKGFTRCNDLPEIQWRNQGETGGGHYEKPNALPKLEKLWQVITWGAGVEGGGFLLHLSIWVLVKSLIIYIYIYIPQILTTSWNGL